MATADTCDGSGQPPAPKLMFGPPFAPSEARSADQTAMTTFCNVTVAFVPSGRRPCKDVPGGFFWPPLGVVAAGHKEIAISELIPTSARGFDWDRPHGVVHGFQITAHKGDPCRPSRNLFSKDCCRASLGDKFSPNRPEVTRIGEAKLAPGDASRLAGAASAPHGSLVGPSGNAEGKRPSADACEEMALDVAPEFVGAHVNDASFVNIAGRDPAPSDKASEGSCGGRIVFIVIGGHLYVVGFSGCVR